MDLGPAGDAGLDAVPLAVAADLHLEQLDEFRTFGPRTHQAHVATHHIDQLGQFVHRCLAHDLADPGAPVLAFHPAGRRALLQLEGGGVRVERTHAAELQAVEHVSVAADAGLREKDRPRGAEPHQQHQGEEDRRDRQQSQSGGHPVTGVLDGELPSFGVGGSEHQQWHPAEVFDEGASADGVHQSRHHAYPHAEVVGCLGGARELVIRHRRRRNDQLGGVACPGRDFEVVPCSQVGHVIRLDVGRADVVDQADRPQAVVRHLFHATDQLMGDRPRTHDQRRYAEVILAP